MQTRDIVYISLFAALTAALGLFPPLMVPLVGVPITAQSIGLMLAGGILGAKRGALSQALFLVLVAAGLPLLSGGRGGFGVFLGPSGGFLIGFVAGAYVVGYLCERFWTRLSIWTALPICFVGGIVVVFALGVPWIAFAAKLSLLEAAAGSASFLPGGMIKVAVAATVIVAVKRAYPLIAPAPAGNA